MDQVIDAPGHTVLVCIHLVNKQFIIQQKKFLLYETNIVKIRLKYFYL